MIDIVHELEEYSCQVDVADYWANRDEVKSEFGIELIENYDVDDYQAIIVAVAHDNYRKLDLQPSKNRVIFDVKGVLRYSDGKL